MSYEGNRQDGRHYWLTPPELMAQLQLEFKFDYDPCPYPQPDGYDGLLAEWGQSNYVNPPFKGPTAWVRKAIAENKKGKRVVFVFPIDKWIHLFLEAGATIRNLKDVKWCATEDGKPGKGTGRHIAAFILEPPAAVPSGKGMCGATVDATCCIRCDWMQEKMAEGRIANRAKYQKNCCAACGHDLTFHKKNGCQVTVTGGGFGDIDEREKCFCDKFKEG